jgi:hypothetical protein
MIVRPIQKNAWAHNLRSFHNLEFRISDFIRVELSLYLDEIYGKSLIGFSRLVTLPPQVMGGPTSVAILKILNVAILKL